MAEGAEKIPLEQVESSNIEALGYNPEKSILAVQFKNGTIYHYAGVSLELVTELYTAESKGSFYSKHVRSKFDGARMTGSCDRCGDAEGWAGDKCDSCGVGVYVVPERKDRAASASE